MEKLEASEKFKLWKSHLIENGLEIVDIEEVYTRRNHKDEVLFSLVMLNAHDKNGRKIPPICFIKGEVVSVLVCLIDEITKQKYLLLVKQRRIAEGGFTYEHPAGMVDTGKSPLEIAIQEVREETGIEDISAYLKPVLNQKRLFPSTGTSDECMYFFYAELLASKGQIEALNNRNTGAAYENEQIQTVVLPFEEAHDKINNTSGLLLDFAYLSAVNDWELLKKLKI